MYKCPNCFHQFKKQDALFRCVAIPQVCAHNTDEIYNEFHKDLIKAQGRVVQENAKGRKVLFGKVLNAKDKTPCDQCSTPTDQRICPHCHHNLPPGFWESDFVAIGFVCQREQELDAYVSSLRKSLEKNVAHDLSLLVKPDSSSEKFDLYLEGSVQGKKAWGKKEASRKIHVRFYPLDPSHLVKTIESLDGLLLLCDKTNAAEGQSFVPESVHNLILAGQGGRKGGRPPRLKVPVGLVYSCFESLVTLLPSTHPLFRQGAHVGGYNQEDGARVSSEMLAYTGYWFGPNLLQIMKRYLGKYRLFCQSFSYPESQPFLANSGWRIEDPFLWVLHLAGKIKGINPGRK